MLSDIPQSMGPWWAVTGLGQKYTSQCAAQAARSTAKSQQEPLFYPVPDDHQCKTIAVFLRRESRTGGYGCLCTECGRRGVKIGNKIEWKPRTVNAIKPRTTRQCPTCGYIVTLDMCCNCGSLAISQPNKETR